MKRLAGLDSERIKRVWEIAFRQVSFEDAVTTRIDSKAAGLLSVVGFCMTLAISFGGWPLLQNAGSVPYGGVIAGLFVAVLAVGIATAICAILALRVRKMKQIDDGEVLDPEALGHKDYDCFVAAHAFGVYEENFNINERRASFLQVGQYLFGAFLLGILAISAMTTFSAFSTPTKLPKIPASVDARSSAAYAPLPDGRSPDAAAATTTAAAANGPDARAVEPAAAPRAEQGEGPSQQLHAGEGGLRATDADLPAASADAVPAASGSETPVAPAASGSQ